MAFYVIERKEQLSVLGKLGDCFVDFIQQNDNFHPKLNNLSLIYIRDINSHKGYILCINHNESFSLEKEEVFKWLLTNTDRLFVLNKKKTLYNFPFHDKLYDINFIENFNIHVSNQCIDFYYKKYYSLNNINTLIPISKHYQKCEDTFNLILPIIQKYNQDNALYSFNNNNLTKVFFEIESQGIKIDKESFIKYYKEHIKNPEFNINKGKIYSNYNLYTTTGRPSNSFNNINFVALNKNNGERLCYIPSNNILVEYDIQGYHPRLVGELMSFKFNETNTYETLGKLLNVTTQEAKELTFKQMYGGVWEEYKDKPFFNKILKYSEDIWDTYQRTGRYNTKNRSFKLENDMTQFKLLNYIIQSYETTTNVTMLEKILEYLKDKKTKLILYTYDAFLFDYSEEDGKQLLTDLKNMIKYPINIKQGLSYHDLEKT